MRRICITLIAFALAAGVFAEKVTLLSFNMGARNRTATEVATMIFVSGADIAFIQEIWVKSPQNAALKTMTAQLQRDSGSDWDFVTTSAYCLTEPQTVGEETYKSGGNGQNNAILYNKSKLSLTDLADDIGFTHFDGDFLFDKNTVQLVRISLASAPDHSAVGINVHLPYTDKAHRARDLRTLERLYARYKLRTGVIIAGDFNYHRKDLTKRNFDFVDGTERWFSDLNAGIPTTLSTKGDTFVQFANDYDHFIYSPGITVTTEMHRAFSDSNERTCERILFGTTEYTSSVTFRKEVSDHVPIVMVIEM